MYGLAMIVSVQRLNICQILMRSAAYKGPFSASPETHYLYRLDVCHNQILQFAIEIILTLCLKFSKMLHKKLTLHLSEVTAARTQSISRLKSRVLQLTFLALKMMVKSGLEFILKFTEPLQRYLLTCQANLALMGRFFGTVQEQL